MQKTIFLLLALLMQLLTVELVLQIISVGQAPLAFSLLFATLGTASAITLTIIALITKYD